MAFFFFFFFGGGGGIVKMWHTIMLLVGDDMTVAPDYRCQEWNSEVML